MKHLIAAAIVALAAATPAHAQFLPMVPTQPMRPLPPLIQQMPMQQPLYPPPIPNQPAVQFHDYTFPNGRSLSCTTYGTGMLATTDCN